MSGETEIEVSVVSETSDLENSSPAPGDLSPKSHKYGYDPKHVRPACNTQYTSFSISSILGRAESPPSDSASAGRATPPLSHHNHHHHHHHRLVTPSALRLNSVRASEANGGVTGSPLGFAPTDARDSIMGHQASDLMLSRYVDSNTWEFEFRNFLDRV